MKRDICSNIEKDAKLEIKWKINRNGDRYLQTFRIGVGCTFFWFIWSVFYLVHFGHNVRKGTTFEKSFVRQTTRVFSFVQGKHWKWKTLHSHTAVFYILCSFSLQYVREILMFLMKRLTHKYIKDALLLHHFL